MIQLILSAHCYYTLDAVERRHLVIEPDGLEVVDDSGVLNLVSASSAIEIPSKEQRISTTTPSSFKLHLPEQSALGLNREHEH